MPRVVALAAILLALTTGIAHGASFRVVVVPGLRLDDLRRLEHRGAVGLLVPGAGPTVDGRSARAALVRGKVENSLRGSIASGRPLIVAESSRRLPAPPAIVVGLPGPRTRPNDRRYPIAVLGHGYRGLLTSPSTRIRGLVSIADVAPTVLGRDRGLGWSPQRDAVGRLDALDRRIREHDARLQAMLFLAGAIALIALASGRAALLAFATALAANLLLGAFGVTALPAVLLAFAVAGMVALPLDRLLPANVAFGSALVVPIALYLVCLTAAPSWIAFSPLGPTQNARFYGLTNVLAALILVPALAAANALRRPLGFGLVAALAIVTVGGTRFGADGGGAAMLAVGYAVLAVGLAGVQWRALAIALPIAAALVLGLVGVDAATGATSHVTRALGGGPGALATDFADRVTLSWLRATDPPALAIAIAGCLVGIAFLVATAACRHRGTPLLYALTAAVATSLLVNDSPLDVSLVGLVGVWAVVAATVQRDQIVRGRLAQPSRMNDGGSSTSWRMLPVRRP
jgi:hypothetical protein